MTYSAKSALLVIAERVCTFRTFLSIIVLASTLSWSGPSFGPLWANPANVLRIGLPLRPSGWFQLGR